MSFPNAPAFGVKGRSWVLLDTYGVVLARLLPIVVEAVVPKEFPPYSVRRLDEVWPSTL